MHICFILIVFLLCSGLLSRCGHEASCDSKVERLLTKTLVFYRILFEPSCDQCFFNTACPDSTGANGRTMEDREGRAVYLAMDIV